MSSNARLYDADFFADVDRGSTRSAQHVVPVVTSLLGSVCGGRNLVDVGCGPGAWCRVWQGNGWRVTGIDGDYAKGFFEHSGIDFIPHNLEEPITMSARFDLATCLEVGEHLSESSAQTLVHSLTALSDIVYFSAAQPGQGGTGHVNEQPLTYWQNLFYQQGYIAFDIIRPRIYKNTAICPWYRYNSLLFVRIDIAEANHDIFLPQDMIRPGHKFAIYDSAGWKIRKSILRTLPVSLVTVLAKIKNKLTS